MIPRYTGIPVAAGRCNGGDGRYGPRYCVVHRCPLLFFHTNHVYCARDIRRITMRNTCATDGIPSPRAIVTVSNIRGPPLRPHLASHLAVDQTSTGGRWGRGGGERGKNVLLFTGPLFRVSAVGTCVIPQTGPDRNVVKNTIVSFGSVNTINELSYIMCVCVCVCTMVF